MNFQAIHGFSETHFVKWKREIRDVHGSLDAYVAETRSGYTADQIERLAQYRTSPEVVPARLEDVKNHFADQPLTRRLITMLREDFQHMERELAAHPDDDNWAIDQVNDRFDVVNNAFTAAKFAAAWEIFSSVKPQDQAIGLRFLKDLQEHIEVRHAYGVHRSSIARQPSPAERKSLISRVMQMRNTLLDASGDLNAESRADIATIAAGEPKDTADAAAYRTAFLRIRTLLDRTERDIMYTDRYFIPGKYREAMHRATSAAGELHAAYGVYVYNELAKRLRMPSYIEVDVDAPASNQLESILITRVQTQVAKKRIAFEKNPTLAAWHAFSAEVERSTALSFVNRRAAQLGADVLTGDVTTGIFADQMRLIHDAQTKESERLRRERLARELSAMEISETSKKSQGAKKKNGPIIRTQSPPQPHEVDLEHTVPDKIRSSIEASLQKRKESDRLEGQTAKDILDNYSIFASVVGFNQKVSRHDGSTLAEFDIHLDNAIVECTLMPNGKDRQIDKLINDRRVNPFGKRVILYGPNQTEAAERKLRGRHGDAVLIARDAEELGLMLFANWSEVNRRGSSSFT